MKEETQKRSGERPSPPAHDPPPAMSKPAWSRNWPVLLIVLLLGLWIVPKLSESTANRTLPYSTFLEHLEQGEVATAVVSTDEIHGTLKPAKEEEEAKPFRVERVEDDQLVQRLEQAGVEYSGEHENSFGLLLLTWIVPFALLFLVLSWLMRSAQRQAGGGMMGFGKSKARLAPEQGTGVTFGDVAGCDEAKDDLREMVEFLQHPSRFIALGARIPKGVLLLGPPGTGKTLLARAVAGEAGVPFFSINGSDFVEMFVGIGAARVRDLFEQAKLKAPCIVFIDEIDAVGRQRGVSMGVVNDEREQTLNQLLSEMDGFEENSGVILLAATNRPEVLDRALLRPGRFDRQVVLDSPDRSGREAILRVHARHKPLAPDVDLERIAAATPGMSGADLANALNEAALVAARDRRTAIRQADIELAIERVLAGPERRSRRLGEQEKRRVAYHEAGHALVAHRSQLADPVEKISIVPRGRAALGYTLQLPEQEQYLRTVTELKSRLRVLMGGHAAEELVLAEVSTGAQDDLRAATALARQMVCLFGMSERVGLGHCAQPAEAAFLAGQGALQRDCSEATAREIDEEVRRLLDEANVEARELLRANRPVLEELSAALVERETLDRAAFEELVGAPPPRHRRRPEKRAVSLIGGES